MMYMELQANLQPFKEEAETYLTQGLVGEIEFSGATYQVAINDAKSREKIWTFLQLDDEGLLCDYFCNIEEDEELYPCAHICAAYLRVYNGHPLPLHKRFEISLWNQLCLLYAISLGDNAVLKNQGRGSYACHSASGKLLFEVKAQTPKSATTLKTILEKRRLDTEETSIKFSNLSQEELKLWREGNPSPQLKYELSYWNDLAKTVMLLQDANHPYTIEYAYSNKGIPNAIIASFDALTVAFYISEANLPLIIPSLSTVKSPLKVFDAPEDEIKKITYNKKKASFSIEGSILPDQARVHLKQRKNKKSISLDRWNFVPSEGFYAKDPHQLLAAGTIEAQQISWVLQEHHTLIAKRLVGVSLHSEPVSVSYTLSFDSEWNLHIVSYLFSPGDLSTMYSRFFGNWAYLDDDGFYKLEDVIFSERDTIVPSDQISDFITKNRSWLNGQQGFHVHPVSIEAQLHYDVNEEGRLTFLGHHEVKEKKGELKDFGVWIYLEGQGFYLKESFSTGSQVKAGVSFSANQIPLFIKINREELAQIDKFFSPESPILRCGLEVILKNNDKIFIRPVYELKRKYRNKNVRFFDDITYVENEGFHELSSENGLPLRYSHEVEINQDNLEFFLIQELPTLEPYIQSVDTRLAKPSYLKLISYEIDKQDKEGSPLAYLVKLKYESDLGMVSATELWKGIKKKKKFLFTSAGLIDLRDRRFDWIRWLPKGQVETKERTMQLTTVELMRLHALDEISQKEQKNEISIRSAVNLRELTEMKAPDEPDLQGLTSTLRPYQAVGVRWLWFLYHFGLSGLLCDDMGLGKTHQTMALIAAFYNERKKSNTTSRMHILIVCPTSVIYHWQEKLAEHLPEPRVYTFYGAERSLEGFQEEYDIILTSYGICRIENQILSQIPFELAIFDEVQLAKNHNSRLHATLLAIEAKMRIGLTGTPIENHLRELKALFDIVLPLYMPSESDYREFFVKPIEKIGDRDRKKLLSRLVKPFVMRRKKEDVLTDLPDKVEEISHCDLSQAQVTLYNEVLQHGRARILEQLQDDHEQIPYIHIFAILSGLKQICDHPAVYLKSPDLYKEFESGKWDLFIELLSEARESQQKIVVYSQYLMMLDIIESYLSERGIGFAAIRGSTTRRGQQLQRFANDPKCEVFVASLQAAGLGIDLTSASVVIHYDRWWNAARENQATDRVHRIGQKRGVQVFKLVTKDTFEERIDALIRKKGKLMEDVVGVDDHEVIKQFTREELLELLEESNDLHHRYE